MSMLPTSVKTNLLSTIIGLGWDCEIRLYSNLLEKILSNTCACKHWRSSISQYTWEGLGQHIWKRLRKCLLREETSLGATGLMDLLKVFFLFYGDTSATVGFLPQSPTLLRPLLLIFSYVPLLWGQSKKPPDVSQAKGHEMCLLTIVCKASVTCYGMLLSSAWFELCLFLKWGPGNLILTEHGSRCYWKLECYSKKRKKKKRQLFYKEN